jgi:hypothetical protein
MPVVKECADTSQICNSWLFKCSKQFLEQKKCIFWHDTIENWFFPPWWDSPGQQTGVYCPFRIPSLLEFLGCFLTAASYSPSMVSSAASCSCCPHIASCPNILSRVWGSMTNNNKFWIGWLDLLALLLQLLLITIDYNSSQSATV